MEFAVRLLRLQHRDGFGAQVGVDRLAHRPGRPGPLGVEVGDLSQGVDAGVRAPGGVDGRRLPREGGDRPLQRALHRRLRRLALEAVERAAVILDEETVAGHQSSRVPAGTG